MKAPAGGQQDEPQAGRKSIRDALAGYEVKPQRRLGQNFLREDGVARRIVEAAGVEAGDAVVEVGPGLGALTIHLARKGARVLAVEVDPRLCSALRKVIDEAGLGGNVKVLQRDIRRIDWESLVAELVGIREGGVGPREGRRAKLVSNPPYYLSSPLLYDIIRHRGLWESVALTLQMEVAQRVAALPGKEGYGALSVLARTYFEPKLAFRVSRRAFFPPPEVDSAVLCLVARQTPLVRVDQAAFTKVVKGAFRHRRKTAANALREALGLDRDILEPCFSLAGVDPTARPDELGPAEFGALAQALGPYLR